jgi:hypothetical protein
VLLLCAAVSTPVSVLRIHVGFRVDGQQLQERLRFVRSTMMPVQHGQFFTFEGEGEPSEPSDAAQQQQQQQQQPTDPHLL